MKPIIKWSGGKQDEIKYFKKYIPDYEVYLEPFFGGGSVFFDIKPKKAIIGDIHPELIKFYCAMKEGRREDIHAFMSLHPNEEKTYYEVRDLPESAERFYYLRKTCYRGMLRYNKSGEFNIPFGRYKKINYSDLLNPDYESIFSNTEIVREDFTYFFENYNSRDNFMFLDPPYLSKFNNYGFFEFDEEHHIKLCKLFKETEIRCLMIVGKCPLIEELYSDYIVEEYDKKYKFKIHSGRVGDEINNKHLIIKNY